MHSIADIQREATRSISSTLVIDLTTSRIEVQCLLQHVLNVQRAYLLAHPEQKLDELQMCAFDALLQRRLYGEPIAHLLGEREFFGLNFKVTSDTLIPRPDTELLVEMALQKLLSLHATLPQLRSREPKSAARVLDLGTGTGAIALSIAHSHPNVEVTAVDASLAALQVARENAQRLAITNACFVQSNWFAALGDQRFDLIVSNPPYISEGDIHLMQGDVRFEPLSALTSGADGLDDLRRIIQEAPNFLMHEGWLLLEHGHDQAERVRAVLMTHQFEQVFSEKDLAGIERVTGGKLCSLSKTKTC